MNAGGWRVYNHILIPTCAPHQEADISWICNNALWKNNLLLARWTTDFDCSEVTEWWYVIKDTSFDLSLIKSKRRYEINKGIKNFEVVRLETPSSYAQEIYDINIDAYSTYPRKYRPKISRVDFIKSIEKWDDKRYYVYGAFNKSDNSLCGYAFLEKKECILDFSMLKVRPSFEKLGINAAIVYRIVQDFNNELSEDFYIVDGCRSVFHETAFQDYLEKYFGFRKAYCKLNIVFNPKYEKIMLVLYKFRKIFKMLSFISIFNKINCVFIMYEFFEKQRMNNE